MRLGPSRTPVRFGEASIAWKARMFAAVVEPHCVGAPSMPYVRNATPHAPA